MTTKEVIVDYLKKTDLYHESDDIVINEIDFNVEMMQNAKEDIRANGIQLDVTRDPDKEPFYQKNRAVDIYQQALRNILLLLKSLVLTPAERQKLKIELSNKVDEFEEAFK